MPKIFHKFVPLVIVNDKSNLDNVVYNVINGFFSMSPTIYGGYKIYKRPGLDSIDKFEYGIDGITYFERTKQFIIVSGGNIYASNTIEGKKVVIYSGLPIGADISFSDVGYGLVIAYGDRCLYYNGDRVYEIDRTEFSRVSKVDFLDGRLIFNDLRDNYRQFIRISEVIDEYGISYNGLWFAEETKSDEIVTFEVVNRLLYIFGTSVITVWHHDGMGVFSRIDPMTIHVGINSIKNVAKIDEMLAFITNDNRVILSYGNNFKNISQPYLDRVTNEIDLSNSNLFFMKTPQGVYLVINAITYGRTFVYSITTNTWGELKSGLNKNFIGNGSIYRDGKTIVTTYTGDLCVLNYNKFLDLDENYDFAVETGHITHGTVSDKLSRKAVYLFFIDNKDITRDFISINISYDTNNRGFSKEKVYNVSCKGDKMAKIVISPNGIYNTRKIKISNSDNCYIEIIGFDEFLEVL